MQKLLVKELASKLIEHSKGRISRVDAEAIAINYLAQNKSFNYLKSKDVKAFTQECVK